MSAETGERSRLSKILRSWLDAPRRAWLYGRKDYLDAYSDHTDARVEVDPHQAVGGQWEELGQLQIDFLISQGLKPEAAFLDLGCGTLRAGRHIIRYLGTERYSGMDISPKAIEYGEQLVHDEGLSHKKPRLVVSRNKDLKFQEFAGERFDVILAHSVFTHLMPEHIEECCAHVGAIMNEGAALFFTFYEGDRYRQDGRKRFRYPFSFFEEVAARHGFTAERLRGYAHPSGQQMVVLRRSA